MRFLIDANLLVLLVVGFTREDIIARHKRLSSYNAGDFRRVRDFVARGRALILSPFVLTEASNITVQGIHGPLRIEIRETIKAFIDSNVEVVVPSAVAAGRDEYRWLGLTDAAIIEQCAENTTLVTSDGPLYAAAVAAGRSVVSLDELRGER